MIVDLATADGDDPAFTQIVSALAATLALETDARELRLVRVARWFDHRWLDFSGKGRVPFDHPLSPDHPGVTLDEFRQDHTTYPPFTPGRVLGERRYVRAAPDVGIIAQAAPRLHPRRRGHSARNLHRRVTDVTPGAVCLWFSSDSARLRRAALMAYLAHGSLVDTWYASFLARNESWQLGRVRGTSPAALSRLLAPTRAALGPPA